MISEEELEMELATPTTYIEKNGVYYQVPVWVKKDLEILDIIGNELLKNAEIDLTDFGYDRLIKNFSIMKWLKEKMKSKYE